MKSGFNRTNAGSVPVSNLLVVDKKESRKGKVKGSVRWNREQVAEEGNRGK